MPVILNAVVTDAGKAAAIAADAGGLELELTDISFHDHYMTVVGTETSIPNEHVKVPVVGVRVGPTQIRLAGNWIDNLHVDVKNIGSIGIWAGATLFAIYAKDSAPPIAVKTPSTDFLGLYELALSVVPPNSVNVIVSADSALLAAITAHEAAADPHPQYQMKVQQFNQMTAVYCTDNGSTPFSIKLNPPAGQTVPARITGQRWLFKAIHSNTIPAGEYYTNQPTTFEPGPFGAQALKRNSGDVVSPGEIVLGALYEVYWDGADYILHDPAGDLRERTIPGLTRHELLINSCFQVNTERLINFSYTWASDTKGPAAFDNARGIYVTDQWQLRKSTALASSNATVEHIRESSTQVHAGSGIKFELPVMASGGPAIDVNKWVLSNTLIANNTIPLRGRAVTFSAHVSATNPAAYKVYLAIGVRDFGGEESSDDVADRASGLIGGGTAWTTELNKTELDLDGATASAQRFSITATIPTDARQISARIIIEPQDVPGAYDVARELYISGANMRIGNDDYQTQVPLIEETNTFCQQYLHGINGDYIAQAYGLVADSTHIIYYHGNKLGLYWHSQIVMPSLFGTDSLSSAPISVSWLDTGTGNMTSTSVDFVAGVAISGLDAVKAEVTVVSGSPALPAPGTPIVISPLLIDSRLY